MAKQTSLIKINGKADGQSFYTSKNGGALMRSINKGMSARVKDAKEYLNTRLNNAEFGACGDLAGALVKAVSSRWRFILNPIATGHLVKVFKNLISYDTIYPWGGRVLQTTQHDYVLSAYTAESKNELPFDLASAVKESIKYDNAAKKIFAASSVALTAEMVAELQAIGADKVAIKFFAMDANGSIVEHVETGYDPAVVRVEELAALGTANPVSVAISTDMINAAEVATEIYPLNDDVSIGGVLVVFMPCRTVGTTTAILQQHCAAAWLPIEAGTIE